EIHRPGNIRVARRQAEDGKNLENPAGVDAIAAKIQIYPRRGEGMLDSALHRQAEVVDAQPVVLELEQRFFLLVVELAFERHGFEPGIIERRFEREGRAGGEFPEREIDALDLQRRAPARE